MQKFRRFILILLSVATGALFLYSAYTKAVPVQAFEYTMVEFTHMPLMLAKIAARFFIGLEAALGALMVLHFFGKTKWPLRAAFGLVVVFSLYLVYLWIRAGDNVNCGCFGDAIWMSPSASLIKNGLLLIALGVLIRYHNGFTAQWVRLSAPLLLLCTLLLPFIIFPVERKYKLALQELYAPGKEDTPSVDLTKGKHIIAFLNPQCMHCRYAGLKLHQLKLKDTTLPFFLVIGGTMSDLTDFWKDSQAQDIPHTRLAAAPFKKITGDVYPQVYWVHDGWVEQNTPYTELDQKVIERWVKQ